MRISRKECLARASLYEEAAEHIELVYGSPELESTKAAMEFVSRHLRREIDRWEIRAEELKHER
jgi:hypothetical protein